MQDKEKGSGSNSIRIVEDTAEELGAAEEVVRLDAPKKNRIEKKGVVAAERIEAKHRESVEMGAEPSHFDPEEEWLDEASEVGTRAVPMGWFFLLGAGLLGVLIWVGYQASANSEKKSDGDTILLESQGSDVKDGPKGKVATAQSKKDAEEHFNNTEELLRNFLGASTPQERVKFVRHPKRVGPLMEDYYSRNEFRKITYSRIGEYQIFPLENLPFLALNVEDEDGNKHAVLVEDGVDGLLVDWESFVCFQPIAIEDYVSGRPLESVNLRAYVSNDYFHSYEFESREKYSSYKMMFRDSEVRLNGYVRRGTELDQKFRKMFPNPESTQMKPLIVKVRFMEGGKALKSVLIEDLESTIWAYSSDPAEVASSEE